MTRDWMPDEIISSSFDETRKHRFHLSCIWDLEKKKALFIMLNPSWASEETCDATVDKCIYYAKKKNCGSVEIVNLFSLISPNPEDILAAQVKSHPDNITRISAAIDNDADYIVAAWGEQGVWFNACYKALALVEASGKQLYCLDTNRYGLPRHPGRLSKSLEIVPYSIY